MWLKPWISPSAHRTNESHVTNAVPKSILFIVQTGHCGQEIKPSRSPIQSKKTFYSLLKIENLCKSGLLQVNNVFEEISPSMEQQTRRLHAQSHAKGIYLNSQSIWSMAIVVIANSAFVTWQLIWKVPINFHGFQSRFNKRQSLGAGLSILCHLISSAAFKGKFGQHTHNTFFFFFKPSLFMQN